MADWRLTMDTVDHYRAKGEEVPEAWLKKLFWHIEDEFTRPPMTPKETTECFSPEQLSSSPSSEHQTV